MGSATAAATLPYAHPGGHGRRALALASLGALGVVYGDIGTSPLYAMKECLAFPSSPHAIVSSAATLEHNVLGVLSLMIWALILVVSVKYLVFVLRADNKGEGGILALSALVEEGGKRTRIGLSIPLLLGLFGAGLLFGDGAITPAISILGAMEGLSEQSPGLAHLIAPITIGIIFVVFFLQRYGTGRIGYAFGPVMLVWFTAIGLVGLRWIVVEPGVLRAVNPAYGVDFLAHHGMHGFLLLGLVVLVVTGGEALYADMGHFGKLPIRIAWFAVALPGLLLNYFGQGAVFLSRPPGSVSNPFYALVEGPLLIPMLVLATCAAVIASQAMIAGVFSLTRQASQLGLWPRVSVVHTSPTTEGQIYIPEMNWLLMVSSVLLVVQFRTSSGLAAAYGIAVTGTMVITTYLFYLVCRRVWHFSQARALAFFIPFLIIDLSFFLASSAKVAQGGWLPLVAGFCVFSVMTTWWRGRQEIRRAIDAAALPEQLFFADVAANPPPRVRGTAVFMTSVSEGIPNVLVHHLKHNQVLHAQVVLMSVTTEHVPYTTVEKHLEVTDLGHGFYRVQARVGFMQSPDVPKILAKCRRHGISAERMTTTYYLGRQTLLTGGTSPLSKWRKLLFVFLARNARPPTAFFNLPPNRVVELGVQIEL